MRLINAEGIRVKPEFMHNVCGMAMIRVEDIVRILNEQPTIEPEPHWIPCSERLPEDYTNVLAWFEYYRYGDYNCMYQTHGIGSYASEYNSWLINGEPGWHKLQVIAWMPLPEPWKGADE